MEPGVLANEEPAGGARVAEAVCAVRRGDAAAEEEFLYRTFARRVLALAGRLLGNSADAEDVAHDAFVIAFERIADLGRPAGFGAWVCAITVRQVHRLWRRRALEARTHADPVAERAGLVARARSDLPPERRDQLRRLDGALAVLSPEERSAWTLRYVQGYKLREVAALSGCSLATVKRRIVAANQVVNEAVVLEKEVDDG